MGSQPVGDMWTLVPEVKQLRVWKAGPDKPSEPSDF